MDCLQIPFIINKGLYCFLSKNTCKKPRTLTLKKQEKELQGLKKIHVEGIEFNIQDQHYIK